MGIKECRGYHFLILRLLYLALLLDLVIDVIVFSSGPLPSPFVIAKRWASRYLSSLMPKYRKESTAEIQKRYRDIVFVYFCAAGTGTVPGCQGVKLFLQNQIINWKVFTVHEDGLTDLTLT